MSTRQLKVFYIFSLSKMFLHWYIATEAVRGSHLKVFASDSMLVKQCLTPLWRRLASVTKKTAGTFAHDHYDFSDLDSHPTLWCSYARLSQLSRDPPCWPFFFFGTTAFSMLEVDSRSQCPEKSTNTAILEVPVPFRDSFFSSQALFSLSLVRLMDVT